MAVQHYPNSSEALNHIIFPRGIDLSQFFFYKALKKHKNEELSLTPQKNTFQQKDIILVIQYMYNYYNTAIVNKTKLF